MMHYIYIGKDPKLVGQTGYGKYEKGNIFLIQVDEFTHEYSHGWHQTPRNDWKLNEESID